MARPDSAPRDPRFPRLERVGVRRLVAAGLAVLVLGSLAFAPVRGMAVEFLKVFRVQKVETVAIDAEELQRALSALESGDAHIDLEDMGEAWVDGRIEPREVTLAEAEEALGFPVVLPDGYKDPELQLQPAATYRFKLNVDKVNEALRSLGATKLLPESVDGKTFSIKITPVLAASYVGPDADDPTSSYAPAVLVGQGRSPELEMPAGVNPLEVRDVLVNLPFLPENLRQQLAAIDDWQNTLLIPNVDGSAQDIVIDGVPAVLMKPPVDPEAPDEAKEHVPVSVIWQRDGVVYGVVGDLSEAKAVDVARSMIK